MDLNLRQNPRPISNNLSVDRFAQPARVPYQMMSITRGTAAEIAQARELRKAIIAAAAGQTGEAAHMVLQHVGDEREAAWYLAHQNWSSITDLWAQMYAEAVAAINPQW